MVLPSRALPGPPLAAFAAAVLLLGLVSAVLFLGCSAEVEPTPVSARPHAELEDLSGIYRVTGTTAQIDGSNERAISGTVTLNIDGDHYTSSYDLKTTFPGRDDELMADVVGTGYGTAEGSTLTGTSQTQLVVSTVPGVDPSFAFVPRVVGLRLTSMTIAQFDADGRVTMESANQPGEGEDYLPTRSTLAGERIAESSTAER